MVEMGGKEGMTRGEIEGRAGNEDESEMEGEGEEGMGRLMDEKEEEDDELVGLMEGMEMEGKEDEEVKEVEKLMEGMKVEAGGRGDDAIARKIEGEEIVATLEEI